MGNFIPYVTSDYENTEKSEKQIENVHFLTIPSIPRPND